MKKNHLDKDFSPLEQEEQLLENRSDDRTYHRCITDTGDISVLNEQTETLKSLDSLTEIVVGLDSEIPLWDRNVTLKWRFNPIFDYYDNADQIKDYVRSLISEAIGKWGNASPIAFQETGGNFDFEVTIKPDNCNARGCTLASAFFPNQQRNVLSLYPKMFTQSRFEQVETMIHEIGHIFGLRHFFAKELEGSWRSEVFGTHVPLTIMNYGPNSTLTPQDKADLTRLYQAVWNGQLSHINGLPIRLYRPFTEI